ncbi:low molecular weight phosphotyrosine protein phosphatase [Stenotrophomonas sp. ATCM1_4]|uniref:low molecular weight protein-tyrosine-phosphatase n=1 Tax=Stenotrophomonas sp. ATCM1_4 TaxID=2259330 RepID=UPI00105254C3|nr:low molecular weight protein-tyrosine-phosphatase [Stenotrophomonas sp. ATCM1_4]TDB27907.1 low molecular weight phosphotyrosine protein phosphatase [Stenotrophomonas sp. ATCM1_4]
MKLLVVCLGNICRSPMGEGALRARIAQARLDWISVDSAGTSGWHAGEPPDRRAVACARRHGVDISSLRGRQLRREDFFDFDYILCADHDNLAEARALAPEHARERAVLWLPWAGIAEATVVPDPYYGGQEDFEHSWALVDAAARATVQRLLRRDDSGIIPT